MPIAGRRPFANRTNTARSEPSGAMSPVCFILVSTWIISPVLNSSNVAGLATAITWTAFRARSIASKAHTIFGAKKAGKTFGALKATCRHTVDIGSHAIKTIVAPIAASSLILLGAFDVGAGVSIPGTAPLIASALEATESSPLDVIPHSSCKTSGALTLPWCSRVAALGTRNGLACKTVPWSGVFSVGASAAPGQIWAPNIETVHHGSLVARCARAPTRTVCVPRGVIPVPNTVDGYANFSNTRPGVLAVRAFLAARQRSVEHAISMNDFAGHAKVTHGTITRNIVTHPIIIVPVATVTVSVHWCITRHICGRHANTRGHLCQIAGCQNTAPHSA